MFTHGILLQDKKKNVSKEPWYLALPYFLNEFALLQTFVRARQFFFAFFNIFL
jgi:hypothetical protein